MTRDDFLAQLAKFLKKAPEHERQSIMAYYTEMLDDRGISGAMQIPADIAPPRQIAYELLRDIELGAYNTGQDQAPKKKHNILLIVILSILALPVGLPIAIVLIAIVVAIFLALLGVIIAVFATLFAAIVASAGIVSLQPITALSVITGIGGILLSVGFIILIISFVRWLINTIVNALRDKSIRRLNA